MRYLVGSRPEPERVWHDWSIVSRRSPKRNDPDFVEHSALVYGIGAGGEITTLYPTSFDPSGIVHDVPILASRWEVACAVILDSRGRIAAVLNGPQTEPSLREALELAG